MLIDFAHISIFVILPKHLCFIMPQADSNITSPLIFRSQGNWGCILLIYTLILFQMLLAVTVGAIVVSHSGLSHFVLHSKSGLALYIVSIVLWFIIQCFLLGYRNQCPFNRLLFLLWSVSFAVAVGFSCSFSNGRGKTVFEAIILMSLVAACVVLYSIWAMIKDLEFEFGVPCTFILLLIISIYVPIQIFHPFAKLSTSIYGCLVALFFCGHTFFAGNSIMEALQRNTSDDSLCGPILLANVFVYWHLLGRNPSSRDIRTLENIRR